MPSKKNSPKAAVTINERVKEIRLALNLSQAKFCRGIPLTRGHYAEIELGNRKVNQRVIKLLVSSYGVSETYLKTGEGAMFDTSVDPKLEELISIFKDLPVNFQNYVLREIKELKKLYTDKP